MEGKSIFHRVFDLLCRISPSTNRTLWKLWYQYITSLDKNAQMIFMNYGFAYSNNKKISLEKHDEIDRYCIQLYNHAIKKVNLRNFDILEVGCGRGGGSSYIMRYLKPKSMIGLDFSEKAVEFCNKHYSIKGLSFKAGDAEAIPFESNKFDIVINVESSHCYPDMPIFLKEINRVLKKKGHFLLADFRNREEIDVLFKQIKDSGFEQLKKEDITKNILKALDLDNARKLKLINQKVPKIFRKSFFDFAAIKGSEVYDSFKNGSRKYFSFTLKNK